MALRLKLTNIHFSWYVYGVLLIFPSFSESADVAPFVTTTSGDVRGIWMTTENNRKIEAFLAIPYAEPPVGPRRFKDPEPSGEWQGVLDGSKEANRCLQLNEFAPEKTVDGSEDCLYLNVYTPSSAGKYPVMIFIHGGGFVNGYANSNLYGPDKLLTKDVVLVTLNYRLGFIGFASYNDPDFSGNYGLKDQSLAVKWVKKNIDNFGGDVGSITVFGESAGAASAHYQVLSPQNKGVFHRAILMSGSADCPWAVSTRNQSRDLTAKMARLVNCTETSATELLKCLREVNGSEFSLYNQKFQTVWDGSNVPLVLFRPTLESSDYEKAIISEESYKKTSSMPIMIGSTSAEGALVLSLLKADKKKSIEKALGELDERFTEIIPLEADFQDTDPSPKERAAKIKKEYFGELTISNETMPQLTKLYSDIYFLDGIKSTIKRHKGETFIYKFGYEGSYSISQLISGDPNYRNGACHADDLLYFFPMKPFVILREKVSDKDKEISSKMIDLFTNFAASGPSTFEASENGSQRFESARPADNPNPKSETTNKWNPSTSNLDFLSVTPEGNFEMKTNFPYNS